MQTINEKSLEQINSLVEVAKNTLDASHISEASAIAQIAIAEYLGKIAAALELYVGAH